MSVTDLHWQPVSVLSRLIHEGSLSPVSLMEHLLERAETLDPVYGAFAAVCPTRALDGARAAELALRAGHDAGPLHGIPFAAKDIIDVQGLVTTAGSRMLLDNVADSDATVVARLRRAGMVLMGKTRTVQFALGAPGINRDLGTPKNPWAEVHHVPGGSSSGSAAAVAAGLVPVALGTDTGGSVRIPAALCGVVGLKPTATQVSRAGVFPLSRTLDSVGPLTRGVMDAAWVHQAMHGADPRDPTTATAWPQDVVSGIEAGVEGLRVAVAGGTLGSDNDPDVARAVEAATETFAELGARVSHIPFAEADRALSANPRLLISSVEAALAHEERLPGTIQYDDTVSFRLNEGRSARGVDYVRALQACASLAREIRYSLRDVDVVISATTPATARPVSEVDSSPQSYQHWNARYSRHTVIANLLGMCAVTLPCGLDSGGLPIGLMIHAPAGGEARVLRVAHAFESAREWRNPGIPDQG